MSQNNYIGTLAVANPNNPPDDLAKSVWLMVNHTEVSTVGLCINQIDPNNDLSTIANSLGINYYRRDPVFRGGDRNTSKVHIIHSLDWYSFGTVPLNDDIGITNDISVLMAIAKDEGPEYYRACAGFGIWEPGVFEQQLSSKIIKNNAYKWELIPATIENIFDIDYELLWETSIQTSIINRVKDFF
jgi:putative AlgH/UPF0301 family transcriptional regulator